MAELGKNSKFETLLNGQITDSIEDLNELKLSLLFDNDNVQADVSTTEQISLVLDGYTKLKAWLDNGNMYEGMPLSLREYNQDNSLDVFDGYIDLSDSLEIDEYRNSAKCKIKKSNGLNSLNDRITGISYGYLKSIGVYSNTDDKTIEYVVEKKFNAFEILVITIVEVSNIIQLAQQAEKTSKDITTASALLTTAGVGSVGASALYAVAVAVLDIAYAAALLLVTIDTGVKMINTFIAPKREAKVISLYKLVANVAIHLGLTFQVGEKEKEELQNVYYLPKNNQLDEIDPFGFLSKVHGTESGLPSIEENTYFVKEGFNLAKQIINGKYAILDNVLHLRNKYDDFWIKKSNYVLPGVQLTNKQYNAKELVKGKVFRFLTDILDEWTIDNYTGTSYAINVNALNVSNEDNVVLTGIQETIIPCALGNKKDKLNALETVLKSTANIVDGVIDFFGGRGNLEKSIVSRVNLLKISSNNYNVPKLLKYKGSKLLSKDEFSAKYIYETYYSKDSFVDNDFYGQKTIYTGVSIPFGFGDVVSVINNSYFTTQNDKEGKFTKVEYDKQSNTATVDFWIREPFTSKLEESKLEP